MLEGNCLIQSAIKIIWSLENLKVITIGVKDENLDESNQAKLIVDSINPKINQTKTKQVTKETKYSFLDPGS